MTSDGKPEFVSLGAKLHTSVEAHKAVKAAVEGHAAEHAHNRYQARAKKTVEDNMMKDIPKGGIQ